MRLVSISDNLWQLYCKNLPQRAVGCRQSASGKISVGGGYNYDTYVLSLLIRF
jgi:hypothetical protein